MWINSQLCESEGNYTRRSTLRRNRLDRNSAKVISGRSHRTVFVRSKSSAREDILTGGVSEGIRGSIHDCHSALSTRSDVTPHEFSPSSRPHNWPSFGGHQCTGRQKDCRFHDLQLVVLSARSPPRAALPMDSCTYLVAIARPEGNAETCHPFLRRPFARLEQYPEPIGPQEQRSENSQGFHTDSSS
jgi:hypothetical protein